MKELKFNTQICTTEEQSQRLLKLGLNSETADMCWHNDMQKPFCSPYKYFVDRTDYYKWVFFPAWSLHRLIEMCNKTQSGMTISIYNDEVIADGVLFEVFDNAYDNLISVIEWLIKIGQFNKEYLKR